MNVNFSNINLNTIIMFALALLLAYLGIAVFKMVGRILSIALGIFLLIYVLQQVGITVPVLTDILAILLNVLTPVIDAVRHLIGL
ncbi:hypothetical protein [Clostridium estertheticum]|uniref:hypothetical protein n=1 Tax=Clostridium estertheticum TaxID=238834 RepID=UPI001CF3B23A|nr:hypothetical protein [Clostridium estertheticum]MCB2356607.1 hypothetical protein [Clostridium estertheticum]MCB2361533.1 hypothetical protein [Clostridium estertheticum]WAG41291.1 hypothetical protein LL065_00630 [Clostridium estertheticum]